jgi:hypothetical protein
MPFNINEFRSYINGQNETAKSDKFDVSIVMPGYPGILNIPDGSRGISLVCEATEFPGITLTPIEFINYGFIQRIPGHLNFPPITLTFICTGQMIEKAFFDSWIGALVSYDTGLVRYVDDNQLKSTITITQYNNIGNPIFKVDLVEAFPLDIAPLSLDWANQVHHRLSVTFSYRKWNSYVIKNESPAPTDVPPTSTPPSNLNNPAPAQPSQ